MLADVLVVKLTYTYPVFFLALNGHIGDMPLRSLIIPKSPNHSVVDFDLEFANSLPVHVVPEHHAARTAGGEEFLAPYNGLITL